MISKLKEWISPTLTFILAGFSIYAVTLDFHFLVRSDDTAYIFRNPFLNPVSLGNLVAIFSNLHFGDYIPLTLLSYSWDFTWWRFDPFGYRLTQVLLHVLNACLLFAILKLLEVPRKAAWLSVLIFIVHPVQVESVVWISERKNLLSSFFIFLSLWFYLQNAKGLRFKRSNYYLCLLSFFSALLSKSIAVMLPCIFVLLDVLIVNREGHVLEKIPFFLLSLLVGLGTIYSQGSLGAIKEYAGGSFVVSQLYTVRVFWDYLSCLVFPFQLSPLYYFDSDSSIGPHFFMPHLLFVGISYFVIKKFGSRPAVIFMIGWFVLWLLPVSNLIPISVMRQDRYLYLPSISLIVGASIGLVNWSGRNKNLANFGAVGIVLFLSTLSFAHSSVYANSYSYWKRVALQNPDNANAQLVAGHQCELIKDVICAEKLYRRTLVLSPGNTHALNNLGALMIQRGEYEEAKVLVEKAIKINPTHSQAYGNRIILANLTGVDVQKIPKWKKKFELFKKIKKKNDYLLGEFRFR
jgi:protein O-mannosyl-transferase